MNSFAITSFQGKLDTLVKTVKPVQVFAYTYHPYFILSDLGRLVSLGLAVNYLRHAHSLSFFSFLLVFMGVFAVYKGVRDLIKTRLGMPSRSFLQDTLLIILPTYYVLIRWVVQADLAEAFDLVALIAPFYLFFARLGCFFSGCCYGIASSWGVWYSSDHFHDVQGCRHFKAAEQPQNRVLPTQLIEAVFSLLIGSLLLYLISYQKIEAGKGICVYFLFYCPTRFVIDFFRVSSARPRYGRFSEAQLVCVVSFIISLLLLF